MVDLDASDLNDVVIEVVVVVEALVVIEMVVVIEVVGVDVVFAVLQLVLLRTRLILVLDADNFRDEVFVAIEVVGVVVASVVVVDVDRNEVYFDVCNLKEIIAEVDVVDVAVAVVLVVAVILLVNRVET